MINGQPVALFAAGKIKSNGLISHTIMSAEALSIYDTPAERPQDYLDILINW